ncbi:MAG: hypothetical protein MUF78_04810 [Candidatus Edwardsbacteria bacterium]|jgi:hypothetical protein|nr:hypothetical protein [Candidatus Edwardsbacteria bacterium]
MLGTALIIPFRRRIVVPLAALCLATAAAAQTDTARAAPGRLRLFETDLRTDQPADTLRPEPAGRHRPCRHHDDEDDTSGSFSQMFGSFFDAIFRCYAGLPNPNYGPFPYYCANGFYAHESGNAVYLTAGAGYQQTYRGIPTLSTDVRFTAAAFVLQASCQRYREPASGGAERLHLAALKIGAGKAPGSGVLWQTHAGLRYLKGCHDQTGWLIGTVLRVFPGNRLGITAGYDLDFFPRYGTTFHDLDGSCSYFAGRAEFSVGYRALITYKGTSLHGPFAGISRHF